MVTSSVTRGNPWPVAMRIEYVFTHVVDTYSIHSAPTAVAILAPKG
jgi:hypothetical protein